MTYKQSRKANLSCIGKLLDVDYRCTAAKHGIAVDKTRDHDLATFPIEEARLRSLKYSLFVCCLLILSYGWLLAYNVVRETTPVEPLSTTADEMNVAYGSTVDIAVLYRSLDARRLHRIEHPIS